MAIDRSNPTVTVDVADSSLNDGDSTSTVTFTFSEAPVGFEASDIAAVGGTVSGLAVTGNPLVYTATLHGGRRLCRHRLGFDGGGQLHRCGAQRRRRGLRHGGDRPVELRR